MQCDTALEIDRRNVKGYFRRGTAFLKSGDAAAALEDFLQVKYANFNSNFS